MHKSSQKGKCEIGDAHSKLQSQVGWLMGTFEIKKSTSSAYHSYHSQKLFNVEFMPISDF